MRPENLKTRIFLDGGDPDETTEIINTLGFLDGQTTNPTLISRHPEAKKRLEKGKGFTEGELLDFYREVVQELASLLPHGSISVEVYADPCTPSEQMLNQAEDMFCWIQNSHIKLPCSAEGFEAAEQATKRNIRVNMTLCFLQEHAAAAYAATRGACHGNVYISPFIGRIDDRGENGMDLISNILRMYAQGDGHVQVLSASVRTYDHFLCALQMGSDIITAPGKILRTWADEGLPLPGAEYRYDAGSLRPIEYKEIPLTWRWQEYPIADELTTRGMEKFSADWNALLKER